MTKEELLENLSENWKFLNQQSNELDAKIVEIAKRIVMIGTVMIIDDECIEMESLIEKRKVIHIKLEKIASQISVVSLINEE